MLSKPYGTAHLAVLSCEFEPLATLYLKTLLPCSTLPHPAHHLAHPGHLVLLEVHAVTNLATYFKSVCRLGQLPELRAAWQAAWLPALCTVCTTSAALLHSLITAIIVVR